MVSFTEVMQGPLTLLAKPLPEITALQGEFALEVRFVFDIDLLPFLLDPKRSLPINEAVLRLPNGAVIALHGRVEWLNLVPMCKFRKQFRALKTYASLRAWPDFVGRMATTQGQAKPRISLAAILQALPSLFKESGSLFNLASHLGGLRELRYFLEPKPGQADALFGDGAWRLAGVKRVEYQPGIIHGARCQIWIPS